MRERCRCCSSMLVLPATSLLVAALLIVGVDCSEDGEPEHVQQEQVLRVAFVGQQEDTQTLPTAEPAPGHQHTTLLPPGVTGRPTVVEYRFGNANNRSSSPNAESEPEPKFATRNYATAVWGVVVVSCLSLLMQL